MKFKIDENLPAECASLLHVAGFETATVGDEQLSGAHDSEIFDRCHAESRVLITLDLDFSTFRLIRPARTQVLSYSAAAPKTRPSLFPS